MLHLAIGTSRYAVGRDHGSTGGGRSPLSAVHWQQYLVPAITISKVLTELPMLVGTLSYPSRRKGAPTIFHDDREL